MELQYFKTDRNGTKYYYDWTCPRCGGSGESDKWLFTGRTCYECGGNGKGKSPKIVKEYTPEYAAKLNAKRAIREKAKREALEAEQAKFNAERAEREAREKAEKEAEEARIKAAKAISQHVGNIGDKIEFSGVYVRSGSWEQKSFRGFGTDTMYIHTFKDVDGNVFIWKTQNGVGLDYGENVIVKGTVKNHSEYQDEKQTELTRCKIS